MAAYIQWCGTWLRNGEQWSGEGSHEIQFGACYQELVETAIGLQTKEPGEDPASPRGEASLRGGTHFV